MVEVTKEDFQAYEAVRASGVTNMYDVKTVSALSGLSKDTIFAVMKQYGKLTEKYPDVRT
jgi:hypothetical protein